MRRQYTVPQVKMVSSGINGRLLFSNGVSGTIPGGNNDSIDIDFTKDNRHDEDEESVL